MKQLFRSTVLAALLSSAPLAFAAEHGTAEDAVALVKKVVGVIKAQGKQRAIEEVNQGKYVDRDLYITIVSMDGVNLANSVNPRLVGKNVLDLKDSEGKAFIKAGLEEVKRNGKGWTDFKWPSPATNKIEAKSTYSERVEDMVVNCGIYK